MKKKLHIAVLTAVAILCALPRNVLAASETIKPEDGDTKTVIASVAVTDAEIAELGLDVVISIPTEIALTRNARNDFEASDIIYAYGVMDKDSIISVRIDTLHEDHGKIYYHKTTKDNSTASFSDKNFYGTVTQRLSNGTFHATETLQNYVDLQNGGDASITATLSVSISGMIPAYGVGKYFTYVPLVIEIS